VLEGICQIANGQVDNVVDTHSFPRDRSKRAKRYRRALGACPCKIGKVCLDGDDIACLIFSEQQCVRGAILVCQTDVDALSCGNRHLCQGQCETTAGEVMARPYLTVSDERADEVAMSFFERKINFGWRSVCGSHNITQVDGGTKMRSILANQHED